MKNLEQMVSKLGGESGQEGGLGALSKLFKSNGGMQGMASKLTQNGMGQHVQSWIGPGENKPISGEQVRQAMEPNSMRQMAQETGSTPEQCSSHVAQILPHVMDQASPDGRMPSEDPLAKGMAALKQLVSSASGR